MSTLQQSSTPTSPDAPPDSPGEPSGGPPHANAEQRIARLGCVLLLLIVLGGGLFGGLRFLRQREATRGSGPDRKGPAVIPVTVARAELGSVSNTLQAVGNVLPHRTVAVTSQVAGQLLSVVFKQGDFVRKGQVLFQVDPRPLQAALDQAHAAIARDRAQIAQARLTVAKDRSLIRQAEANLARDQASYAYAVRQDKRYGSLLASGYVTTEQAEQQAAAARSQKGIVDSDTAAIASVRATLEVDAASVKILESNLAADEAVARNATVQLGFATIRAPLDGRTGSLSLYAGAVVKANDPTPLITIDEITPVYIAFAVPEKQLPAIRRAQRIAPIAVTAAVGGTEGEERGRVSFIDNAVDTSTGTITLRATFDNPHHRLWPGRYANVTLHLGSQRNVVLVPEQAVQPGQSGDYVFVLSGDDTVASRAVKVDTRADGKAVIAEGLKAGETVVTDGQLQLTPGAKVRVHKP